MGIELLRVSRPKVMNLIPCSNRGCLPDAQCWWMHPMCSCNDTRSFHFESKYWYLVTISFQPMLYISHHTINRVLINHKGLVMQLDVAPADMADAIWTNQALSASIPNGKRFLSCHVYIHTAKSITHVPAIACFTIIVCCKIDRPCTWIK